VEEHGFPDLVFARNVVPHVANLHDFVQGISLCCNNETIAAIEVHYAGTIMEELHYDSIYHEHLCYFTLKSLAGLFAEYGLFPFDIMESPISGGSIVVYMSKEKKQKSQHLMAFETREKKSRYNDLAAWMEFAKKAEIHRQQLRNVIEKEKKADKKIIAYGASARSSTMLNFCGIDKNDIPIVIDQNVRKQGKYTPGSHILIQSAKEAMDCNPDTIVLLAWNFKDEITDYLKKDFQYKGKVIVPLPYPVKEMEELL
jgi:hypothetical protein